MPLTLVPAPTSVADEPVSHPDDSGAEPYVIPPHAEVETPIEAPVAVPVVAPIPEPIPPFVFAPQAKPVRFAWELGHDNRVVRLGPEFANTLGQAVAPHSWARVGPSLPIGFSWDADKRIAGLIHGRSAWHGQTVDWPVEGMALRVPVTLTAMPLRDADRQVAGFTEASASSAVGCRRGGSARNGVEGLVEHLPHAPRLIPEPPGRARRNRC